MSDAYRTFLASFSALLKKEVEGLDAQILNGAADWEQYLRLVGSRGGLIAAGELAKKAMVATEEGE